MRRAIKHLASLVMIPAVRWYLRKERTYTYKKITVKVKQGVFHPGLFSSTKFLFDFLDLQDLQGHSLLELGCGSGLISILAAKNGAQVIASDLNAKAVENTSENAGYNNVYLTSIHSDLFDRIEKMSFDWIVINPPYYAQDPRNEEELAWYCGEDFQYFKKLFKSLCHFVHPDTKILMVLTKGCNLDAIMAIAKEAHFNFHLVAEKNVLFDGKDFLFQIQSINASA